MENKESNILFHYTTLDSFFNIIKSQSLRLYQHTTTSDEEEGNHAFRDIYNNCLNRISGIKFNKQEAVFVHLFKNILRKETYYNAPFYFFSLSKKSDCLSQWRAFSNNGKGVSIGFNLEKIFKNLKNYNCHILKIENNSMAEKERNESNLLLEMNKLKDIYNEHENMSAPFSDGEQKRSLNKEAFNALSTLESKFIDFVFDMPIPGNIHYHSNILNDFDAPDIVQKTIILYSKMKYINKVEILERWGKYLDIFFELKGANPSMMQAMSSESASILSSISKDCFFSEEEEYRLVIPYQPLIWPFFPNHYHHKPNEMSLDHHSDENGIKPFIDIKFPMTDIIDKIIVGYNMSESQFFSLKSFLDANKINAQIHTSSGNYSHNIEASLHEGGELLRYS